MIKEVVIPAAGLGTRFLPLTKSVPKEMLPIINKPAIEYIVQEAILSGINSFFIISNKNKKAISDYFKKSKTLYNKISDKKKLNLLLDLDNIINQATFYYINQIKQIGLGHAILMAKDFIKNDFFGVMLPDDIVFSSSSALSQLIKVTNQENATVLAVQEVSKQNISSYGIIEIKKKINSNTYQVANLVEKPNEDDAPSNLAIVGRYILSHKIFESIEKIQENKNQNEIQLTDAIAHMLKKGEKVFAYKIEGCRYDIGTPQGWLKANMELSKNI